MLVDKKGQTFRAERTERGWRCPRDSADLGDLSGFAPPRVGSQCPQCGAVAFKIEEGRC